LPDQGPANQHRQEGARRQQTEINPTAGEAQHQPRQGHPLGHGCPRREHLAEEPQSEWTHRERTEGLPKVWWPERKAGVGAVTVFPRATNHHPYRSDGANDSSGVLSSRYGQGHEWLAYPIDGDERHSPHSILMNKVTETFDRGNFALRNRLPRCVIHCGCGATERELGEDPVTAPYAKNPLIPSTTSTAAAIGLRSK